MKRANTNAGQDLPTPSQAGSPIFSSPPPSSDEGEGYYEAEDVDNRQQWGAQDFDWPEDPELGWYLSHWEMTDLAKIAVCRTYANY